MFPPLLLRPLLVAVAVSTAAATFLLDAQPAVGQASAGRPKYASDGHLLRPTGYEKWVFVGSNLGLVYDPNLPVTTSVEAARAAPHQAFHNIYIDPEAYEYFLANKEFPDPTMLVMDRYEAADKQGVLVQGVYNGESLGIEVAVKNSHRPDGETTLWAYYSFGHSSAPAMAHDDSECEACHRAHASHDHVWVQFYPILRKLME